MSIQIICPFKKFFFYWVVRVLYIFWIWADIWFANIFSHLVGYLFALLTVSFVVQSFLVLEFHLFIFAFSAYAFRVRSKKSSPRLMSRSLPSIFFWGFYHFRSYIWVFNLFWVNFCICLKIVSFLYLVSFFCMWLSSFQLFFFIQLHC